MEETCQTQEYFLFSLNHIKGLLLQFMLESLARVYQRWLRASDTAFSRTHTFKKFRRRLRTSLNCISQKFEFFKKLLLFWFLDCFDVKNYFKKIK
jgi:hypothetical protein